MRILLRIIGAIALLVALALAGLVGFTFTASFNEMVREQLVGLANGAIRGELGVAAIDGTVWSGITLRDVRVTYEGEVLLSASALAVRYDLLALLGGDLEVTEIELVEPVVRLDGTADGGWTLVDAFSAAGPEVPEATEAPAEESALPITVQVSSAIVRDGTLRVSLPEEPPRVIDVDELSLEAGAGMDSEGIDAVVRSLQARIATEDAPPVRLDAVGIVYEDTAATWRVAVDRIGLESEASKLAVEGEVEGVEPLRTRVAVHLDRLAADELRKWIPGVPLRADVVGGAEVAGPLSDLEARVELRAADATLVASGRADVSGDAPTFQARLELGNADLERLLVLDTVGGTVAVDLRANGTGTEIASIGAEGTITVSALRVGASPLGDVETRLALDRGQLRSEGTLRGRGRVEWTAAVGIEEERYELTVESRDVDLGGVAPAAAAIGGRLDVSARLRGVGFEPARMTASAEVDLRPSKVGPVALDRGKLSAEVADGRLRVHDLTLRASGARLSVQGGLGLTSGAEARLDYDLEVSDLKPWLELAGQAGGGSLELEGSAEGALDELATKGRLELAGLRVAGTAVEDGTLDFDVAGIGAGWPHGTARLSLREVEAGQSIERLEATADLDDAEPPRARLGVEATMWEGRRQKVRAVVELGPAEIVALVEEIRLEVPVGTWALDGPARIVRSEERLAVENLRLSSGAQSLLIDGALAADGGSELRVVASDFDVGVAAPFTGDAARDLRGRVDAAVTVRGTPDDPSPSGTLALRDGYVHVVPLGVTIEDITADADFAPERVNLSGASARAGEGTLELRGGLDLGDGDAGRSSIDLTLAANRWPAIFTDRFKAIVGADVRAAGTLAAPVIAGRVRVMEADLRPDFALLQQNEPPPRDRTIVVVGADVPEPTESEEGAVIETPSVAENVAIDLTVEIERNTWVKRDDSALELAGEVDIDKKAGSTTPILTGSVRVVRGWIYLYGRRFEPQTGIVTFTGGREVDPSLDLVLVSRVGQYQVRTIIGGTANAPTLAFESSPRLEQADVLAVLMFGKPVSQLGQGEQASVQRQAAEIAAGYAANEIGRALGDMFGFQISEIDVGGRRVGVGRYLTEDTYVSINQELGGDAAREVKIEYYVTPSWTLQTQTDSEGESGADVFWRHQY